jgi:hypothetical protein
MHIFIILLVIVVVMVIASNLHSQGLITAWKGPNNNLGCIPLLLFFIFCVWVITLI